MKSRRLPIQTPVLTQPVGDKFQHAVAGRIQFAIFLDEAGRHLGVAMDFGALVVLQLKFAGLPYPPVDGRRTFGLAADGQVAVFDGRHFEDCAVFGRAGR